MGGGGGGGGKTWRSRGREINRESNHTQVSFYEGYFNSHLPLL
jgi:hypothetical protein